jgi:hypothetical protein
MHIEINNELSKWIDTSYIFWDETIIEKSLIFKDWHGFGLNKSTPNFHVWDTFSKKIPLIVQHIRNCEGTVLYHSPTEQYLIYIFKIDGAYEFYKGNSPVSSNNESNLLFLPSELASFYYSLHNGFTYLPANSMGPLNLKEAFVLSAYPGDDVRKKIGRDIDLSKFLAILNNGAGDFLCINKNGETMIVWHDEDKAEFDIEYWDTLDNWVDIFLAPGG